MAAMCVAPVMPGQKLPINVDTDLTPIANIAGVYNMLVFGKHVAFRTVPELIEQARKNPGKLTYASAGNGTVAAPRGRIVPEDGGRQASARALSRRRAGNPGHGGGQLRHDVRQHAGVPGPDRRRRADPDRLRLAARLRRSSPICRVISKFLPGFEVVELVRRVRLEGPARPTWSPVWNKALRTAVAKPDLQKRFVENGMDTVIGSPEELKATIIADRKKWAGVIKEAGIRAD